MKIRQQIQFQKGATSPHGCVAGKSVEGNSNPKDAAKRSLAMLQMPR
jgi:hypothetical protein